MSEKQGCDFEQTVVKSIKSGLVGGEISEHIKACADCSETAKVMQFFQMNLPGESPPKNLPAAGLVWWKFRLQEKQRRAERVAQPILIAQIAAGFVAFVMIVWLRQSYSEPFFSLQSALGRIFESAGTIAFPFAIGLSCFALVSAIFVLTLRRLIPDK
jgi:hypothetical protein